VGESTAASNTSIAGQLDDDVVAVKVSACRDFSGRAEST